PEPERGEHERELLRRPRPTGVPGLEDGVLTRSSRPRRASCPPRPANGPVRSDHVYPFAARSRRARVARSSYPLRGGLRDPAWPPGRRKARRDGKIAFESNGESA